MLRIGDTGPAVRVWQAMLASAGARLVIDGDFGPATHNATLAYQARHGLPTTGVVDTLELDTAAEGISRSVRPPPILANTIPLVLARFYSPTVRKTVDNIVLHSMEAPEASTTAERVANYFATLPADTPKEKRTSPGYCLDSDTVIQCVPDHCIAFHARGFNLQSIGLEHAGYARQTREEWLDAFGERMLGLSVQLAARLCARWSIPPVIVRADELLKGARGITTHAEVNAAFHKSDHTDPGPGFPLDWYGERVAALMVAQKPAV